MNSEKLLVYPGAWSTEYVFRNQNCNLFQSSYYPPRGRGRGEGLGATPLYKLYRYMPPHRVGFLHRFALKTGIHFAHFGVESGMVFEGTTESINLFIVLIPNE